MEGIKTVSKTDQKALDPWEMKVPQAPHKAAYLTAVDVAHGGGALAATTLEILVDEGLCYEIDDVGCFVSTAVAYVAGVSAATISFGVGALHGSKNSSADIAVVEDYLVAAAALPDTAVRDEISVGNGDLAWAATANTLAKRQINGPAVLRVTCVAANGAGSTGVIYPWVKYHACGSGAALKYALADEPADL